MKRAGELLSVFFDGPTLARAREHWGLAAVWEDVAGGTAMGDHARVAGVEQHILRIETDHPGWVSLLQMKQRYLLGEFQRRLPDLGIRGISFRLSCTPGAFEVPKVKAAVPEATATEEQPEAEIDETLCQGMDEDLRRTFRRLRHHLL